MSIQFIIALNLLIQIHTTYYLLSPLNGCLGNCMMCDIYDLQHCIGPPNQICAPGYFQSTAKIGECIPDQNHRDQIKQLQHYSLEPELAGWSHQEHQICDYPGQNGSTHKFNVLGFFYQHTVETKQIYIKSYHRSAIISFNIIRNAWEPLNDYLMIKVSTDTKLLSENEVSFDFRDVINENTTLFRCHGAPFKLEKYQIHAPLGEHSDTKITLQFQSFMYAGATWGITNIHMLIGCSHFISPDKDGECTECQVGFYKIYKNLSFYGCERCESMCLECSSRHVCLRCAEGTLLHHNQCHFSEGYNQLLIPSISEAKCGDIEFIKSNDGIVVINEVFIPAHMSLSIIFILLYDPGQWNDFGELQISINDRVVHSFTKNSFNSFSTGECSEFLTHVFEQEKLITPTFNNTHTQIKLTIEALSKGKHLFFGIRSNQIHYIYYNCLPGCLHCHTQSKSCLLCSQGLKLINNSCIQSNIHTTQFNKSETIQLNKSEITQLNKSETTQFNKSETTQFNKSETTQFNKSETTQFNKSETIQNENNAIESEISKDSQVSKPRNEQQNNNKNSRFDTMNNSSQIGQNQKKRQQNLRLDENTNKSDVINDVVADKQKVQLNQQRKHEISQVIINNEPPNSQVIESKDNQTKSNVSSQNNYTIPSLQLIQLQDQRSTKIEMHPLSCYSTESGIALRIEYPSNYQKPLDNVVIVDKLGPKFLPIVHELTFYSHQTQQIHILINHSFVSAVLGLYKEKDNATNLQLIKKWDVIRFDPIALQEKEAMRYSGIFLELSAWICVIGMVVSVPLGLGIAWQQFSLVLQFIFLHTYIYSEYLPGTLKYPIGSLWRMESLNYWLPNAMKMIEEWLLGFCQYSPLRLIQYHCDINFTRSIYPIFMINLMYIGIFCVLLLISSLLSTEIRQCDNRAFIWLSKITHRKVNYFDQIWRYQFAVVLWACFIQFYNFQYPPNVQSSAIINAFFCFIALILTISWPMFVIAYSLYQKNELQIMQYYHYFEGIYYKKLSAIETPSLATNLYVFTRHLKYVYFVFSVALLAEYPLLTLIPIIVLNTSEIVVLLLLSLYKDRLYLVQKIIENIILIIIDLLMVVLYFVSSSSPTSTYFLIGHAIYWLINITIVNCFIRTIYLLIHKIKEFIYLGVDYQWIIPFQEEVKTNLDIK